MSLRLSIKVPIMAIWGGDRYRVGIREPDGKGNEWDYCG